MSTETEITNEMSSHELILPRKKTRRWQRIALGILIIVAFSVGGVFWQLSLTNTIEVLATNRAIAGGEAISRIHLRVVEINDSDSISYIKAEDINAVIGMTASVQIGEGTIITPEVFSFSTPLSNREAIIGVALDAGQYPIQPLLRGDLVDVIVFTAGAPGSSFGNIARIAARAAEVFAVTEIGGQTRLLVSLRVPRTDTLDISAAASQGRVWLTLVTG